MTQRPAICLQELEEGNTEGSGVRQAEKNKEAECETRGEKKLEHDKEGEREERVMKITGN